MATKKEIIKLLNSFMQEFKAKNPIYYSTHRISIEIEDELEYSHGNFVLVLNKGSRNVIGKYIKVGDIENKTELAKMKRIITLVKNFWNNESLLENTEKRNKLIKMFLKQLEIDLDFA